MVTGIGGGADRLASISPVVSHSGTSREGVTTARTHLVQSRWAQSSLLPTPRGEEERQSNKHETSVPPHTPRPPA